MNLPNSEWFTNGSCMYIQRQFVSWHITSTIFLQLWTVLCIFENVCFHRNQKATFVVAVSGKAPTPQPLAQGHLRRWLLRWYWAFGHSVGESLWQRPLPRGLCRWRSGPTSFWGRVENFISGKTSGPRPRFKMLEEKSKHVSRLKTLQIKQINKHNIYINKKNMTLHF